MFKKKIYILKETLLQINIDMFNKSVSNNKLALLDTY